MAQATHTATGWTGWIVFASVIMMLSGIMNVLYGIGSLFTQTWYIYAANQIYLVDATSGGWALLAIGLLLFISGALLLAGNAFGRIMGIVVALLSIAGNLAYIGVAPVWSIIAIVLSAMVIYAIGAHGSEMKEV